MNNSNGALRRETASAVLPDELSRIESTLAPSARLALKALRSGLI